MKPLEFVGASREDLRSFPAEARRAAGFELSFVQQGLTPTDWKPMKEVGSGPWKYASTFWVNGALSTSPSSQPRCTSFMPLRRRPAGRGETISSWLASGTGK